MKIKSKIFKSEFSDMIVEVYESGFIALENSEGKSIVLGCPPNARFDLINQAIKYVKDNKK